VIAFIAGVGSLVLAAVSFLLGKVFSQSERVLDQKREAYERFLAKCPAPNEAHCEREPDFMGLQRDIGVLSIYGSKEALIAAGEYFTVFASAQPVLTHVEEPGHPEFLRVMKSYNKMVWEMRKDALTWSVFAPSKKDQEYSPSHFAEPKK